MLDLSKDFTIEMWVRWQSSNRPEYFAGDEAWPKMSPEVDTIYKSGWVLRKIPGRRNSDMLNFTFGTIEGGWVDLSYRFVRSGGSVHLAVCRRDDKISLYANGKRLVSKSIEGMTLVASPTGIFLGGTKFGSEKRRLMGDIAVFRISDEARYRITYKPKLHLDNDEHTLVLYDFLKQTATGKAEDLSGHSRHGKLDRVTLLTADQQPLEPKATIETAEDVGSSLLPDEKLEIGDWLISSDGQYKLTLVDTGHLVLTRESDGEVLWTNPTRPNLGSGKYAHLQEDGNLVIRSAEEKAVWGTRTFRGGKTFLEVQTDGNLVLYREGTRKAVWSSRTKE